MSFNFYFILTYIKNLTLDKDFDFISHIGEVFKYSEIIKLKTKKN